MPSHKWHIEFSKRAKKQLKELSSEDRMRVFHSIATLLKADDPQAIPGVKKLEGTKSPLYRQRKGNYRIIFYAEVVRISVLGFVYKGILYIAEIALHREGY
jgi:mRNA-degrading endonuclease RelE of RelBE toxin-antitoxin system